MSALAGEELTFRNGTVFDGSQFLPAGTGVRIREVPVRMYTAGAKVERNVVPLWPNLRLQSSERGFGSKAEKIPKHCSPVRVADP